MNLTPAMRRILDALDTHGDMGARDIADEVACSYTTLTDGGYLRRMLEAELIRIARYERAPNGGPAAPIYSVTPGENAKRPKPYTDAQKCRRWRQRSNYRKAAWTHRQNLAALVRITSQRVPAMIQGAEHE